MRRVAVEVVVAGNAAELHRCWSLSDPDAWPIILYIFHNCIGIFSLQNSFQNIISTPTVRECLYRHRITYHYPKPTFSFQALVAA